MCTLLKRDSQRIGITNDEATESGTMLNNGLQNAAPMTDRSTSHHLCIIGLMKHVQALNVYAVTFRLRPRKRAVDLLNSYNRHWNPVL